jgi:hypothetical protein
MSADQDRAAEELEALVAAQLVGQEPPETTSLVPEDAAMARELVQLAQATRADPVFAARLENQLRARATAAQVERRWWRSAPGGNWRRIRIAWGAAALALVALFAVPPVRAHVIDVIQIGVVRILRAHPEAPSAVPPTAAVSPSRQAQTQAAEIPGLATPTPVRSVLDLAGATTLAEAQRKVTFPIRLPSYPLDLGPPDRVFVQDLGGPVVVLAWLEPGRPDRVRLSLHLLVSGYDARKGEVRLIERTTVNGRPAVWTEGPYALAIRPRDGADVALTRLVTGHTLLWEEHGITYRLETNDPLSTAIRIAESLR